MSEFGCFFDLFEFPPSAPHSRGKQERARDHNLSLFFFFYVQHLAFPHSLTRTHNLSNSKT